MAFAPVTFGNKACANWTDADCHLPEAINGPNSCKVPSACPARQVPGEAGRARIVPTVSNPNPD